MKSEKVNTHHDLDVWKRSISYVTKICELTETFPSEERSGLISQIRRSAISIPSNVAEGAARRSDKEFLQFFYISLGSVAELETQLIISNNLKFMELSD
ncbi:MAG: four helix bundle protein [Candidatus Neomarinimicrobiota bacterium]|nr:four helix bundle protein [Candidatus Neomarinimicrobiota bacterium]